MRQRKRRVVEWPHVFSIPRIGRLIGACDITIKRLMDDGELDYFELRNSRMVSHESLLDFARKKNMKWLVRKLIAAGSEAVIYSRTPEVRAACADVSDTVVCPTWYETAKVLSIGRPRGLLLDLATGREECAAAVEALENDTDRPTVIAVTYGDSQPGPWDYQAMFPDELHKLRGYLDKAVRR